MLSKSGSTQFPGEGNAIAYAVQDSTSASDTLHSILLRRQNRVGAVGAMLHLQICLLCWLSNLQELLRNQPARHITSPVRPGMQAT